MFASIAIIIFRLSNVAKIVVDSIFTDIGLDAYMYSPVGFKFLILINATDISIIYNDQLTNI